VVKPKPKTSIEVATAYNIPLWQALVFELKAVKVGPERAALCTVRREEAKGILSAACSALEEVETTLNSEEYSSSDLEEINALLAETWGRCTNIEYSLEILAANSAASKEGPEVMAEYEELVFTAVACSAKMKSIKELMDEINASSWTFDHFFRVVVTMPMTRLLEGMTCNCASRGTNEYNGGVFMLTNDSKGAPEAHADSNFPKPSTDNDKQ